MTAQQVFDFPLIILTRATDSDEMNMVETSLQAELLKFSSRSQQYFSKHDDHYIQNSEPGLVIDAIRQVVGSVKSKGVYATAPNQARSGRRGLPRGVKYG